MAATASTPTTTPPAMAPTLVPPEESEDSLGASGEEVASAAGTVLTIVWPGAMEVMTEGLAVVCWSPLLLLLPPFVLVGVGDADDESALELESDPELEPEPPE